jgi:competence protein ComEA
MSPPARFPEFLRRTDQAAVAVLLLWGATVVMAWLAVQSGFSRWMTEADRPEPKVVRFQVDVNTAEYSELIQLPGVGEKLAQKIMEEREVRGPFQEVEDLRSVRGIGPKSLEKLRPFLRPPRGSPRSTSP